MKKLRLIGVSVLLAGSLSGCLDEYLTTEPETILTNDQLWSDPQMILGVLSNFYSRLPDYLSLTGANEFSRWDEAVYSGNTGGETPNLLQDYPYSTLAAWNGNYELIRDINVAIDQVGQSTSPNLTAQLKDELIAELRFQRAWTYFDLVKRMGGVPLLTEQKVYDFSGDPSYLQQPRNAEAEIYDFIAAEMDAVAPVLGNAGDPSRANRYAALALKSRAMLYAASIARHNDEMPSPITVANGVVGIPASRAAEYYQKSLDASREIINSGEYALYDANPDPGENFYEMITNKNGNREVIWVKDYSAAGARTHNFTQCIIPPSLTVAACGTSLGAALSPRLSLVENFDFLDGSGNGLRGVGDGTAAGQENWIFYDTPDEIFEGKDGRLYGTVIYPGSSFRGSLMKLQAGVYVWNASTGRYDKVEGTTNSVFTDGEMLTGQDGPKAFQANVTPTGFYVRKFLDPTAAGATGAGSEVWWVRFRLGEIYMNAAEAAYELGLEPEAVGYVNTLRERAGFPPNSLTSLSRDKIRSERWAELAFEDHRVWDLKRWRIAHILWDGTETSPTANAFSLWGYRVVHPGHPNDGKYVYDKIRTTRLTYPRYFREGNYYSEIPANVRGNNPQLVANPFH